MAEENTIILKGMEDWIDWIKMIKMDSKSGSTWIPRWNQPILGDASRLKP